jgi:hypothetical protein
MNQFEVAQGFIEQCQAGAPGGELAQAFDPFKPSSPQQEMFLQARHYRQTRGYTVPIHSHDAPRADSPLLQRQQSGKDCAPVSAGLALTELVPLTGNKDRRVKKLSSRARTMRTVN